MKKNWILLVVIFLALTAIVALNGSNGLLGPKKDLGPRTDSQAEVDITVKPVVLEVGKEAVFEIVFDTHTVPLDFDLAEVSKLADGEGNVYQPISWSGGSGGHHLSGTLSFPPIPKTKFIEFTLSGINNIDRNFRWDL